MKLLVILFIVFIFVKTFIVSFYWIPSTSMEDTILVGDYCVGLKTIYGPVIPFTTIKLPLLSHPKRGDVVIFSNSVFNGLSMIKRCVALSGDTVSLKSKQLYVNGVPSVYESLTKHIDKRHVEFRDNFDNIIIPKKDDVLTIHSDDIHKFEIEKNLFVQLYGPDITIQRSIIIDSVEVDNYKFETYNLPNITSLSLSDNLVTYSELYDYIQLIKDDSQKKVIKIKQILYKQGRVIDKFKVYENCYFLMGDNRDASNDSRFWGYITDRNIVAMPLFIYYSYSDVALGDSAEGVRWIRIGQLMWR